MYRHVHEQDRDLPEFIQEGILTAEELGYSEEAISKIRKAKGEFEVERILKAERERMSDLQIDLDCYRRKHE